jgi:hypothetical protein
MSDSDRAAQAKGERAQAVRRLTEAVSHQRRLRNEREAAKDSPGGATAARLADDERAHKPR